MLFSHLQQTFSPQQPRLREASMCLIWGVHINLSLFNVTFSFEVLSDWSKHSKSGIHGSRELLPSFPTSEHLTEAQYKELNNKAAPLLAELQAFDFEQSPWVLFPWTCGFLSTQDSPLVSVVRSNIKTLPGDLKDFTYFRWSHIEMGKCTDTRVCLYVEAWAQPSHAPSALALLTQGLPLPPKLPIRQGWHTREPQGPAWLYCATIRSTHNHTWLF